MKQQNLFTHKGRKSSAAKEWRRIGRKTHGGDLAIGKRKSARPFAPNKLIHIILKSEKARGPFGFLTLRNQKFINKLLQTTARGCSVRIVGFANVGNHLHITLRAQTKDGMQNFLRVMTAQIARFVTGARRGKPFGKFWTGLAYTRLVGTRYEELQLQGYLEANRIEASSSKAERAKWLEKWNRFVRGLRDG